jgi:hypothetical protein
MGFIPDPIERARSATLRAGAKTLVDSTHVDLATAVAATSGTARASQSSDLKDQYYIALGIGIVLMAIGLLLAGPLIEFGPKDGTFKPGAGFDLFAAFYLATQAIERFTEVVAGVMWPRGDDAATKADRAWVFFGFTLIIGVVASKWMGLFLAEAIGWTTPSRTLDILISGLVIAGGSKGLHDLITRVKAPAATTP